MNSMLQSLDIEGQCRDFVIYIKSDRSSLKQWQAAITTHGEATANGDATVPQMVGQHLFNAVKLKVVLNSIKLSKDNAFHTIEHALQPQHIEKAVYRME